MVKISAALANSQVMTLNGAAVEGIGIFEVKKRFLQISLRTETVYTKMGSHAIKEINI